MFGIKRRRRLEHENAQMRIALEWYADSDNWKRRAAHEPGEPVKWIKSPAAFDRGSRAKFVVTLVLDNQPGERAARSARDLAAVAMSAIKFSAVKVPNLPAPRADDVE